MYWANEIIMPPKTNKKSTLPTGRFASVNEKYHPLLSRVNETVLGGSTSYQLNDKERKHAKELVNMGLLFYSMDYDHVCTYRLAHE